MSCYLGYEGPNPPRGETHHYQFLLYEQPAEGIDTSLKRRIKFDLKRFLEINDNSMCTVLASLQYRSYKY
jgi:phosphatidylethanolamine-binding protein (PEBP) family uncharacterized protein